MKEFLSIEKFQELKILFVLQTILFFLLSMIIHVNKIEINFWNWKALCVSIGMWATCSIIDKKKYFNLATFTITGAFMYLCWWFLFLVF